MTVQQVLAELNLDTDPELLAPHWDEDLASLPAVPELLRPEVFLPLCDYVRLDPAVGPLLEQVAAEIRGSEALRTLWWHCYRLLFHHLDYPGGQVRQWPVLDGLFGDLHGLPYLLVALGVVPLMKEKHQARGIPDEVTRGVYGNFEELMDNFAQLNHGLIGADLRVIYWLRHDSEGELYRLGRMEYMNRPFGGQVRVFRSRRTGEVLALAEDGVCYTADGYIGGPGGPDDPGNWTSVLDVNRERVRGHLVHPLGHALRDEVLELPLSEWECALQRGDHVLDTHIPGGGGFHPDLCRDSMRQAAEFFAHYFPEQPYVGFGCMSWILNPQWHLVYRPDSNMTKWQEELYLFPIPSSGRDGLHFLFATGDIDLHTAPRDTSMRRAVLDWLLAGKWLRGGGAFMLTEQLAGYGSQYYRSQPRVA